MSQQTMFPCGILGRIEMEIASAKVFGSLAGGSHDIMHRKRRHFQAAFSSTEKTPNQLPAWESILIP